MDYTFFLEHENLRNRVAQIEQILINSGIVKIEENEEDNTKAKINDIKK